MYGFILDNIPLARIAVSVSGGRDSMALLHLLLSGRERGYEIGVVNFEHGIRGASSLRDSEFVRDYCKEYGLECEIVSLHVPEVIDGETVEQCARRLRYEHYTRLLDSGRYDYVATAHHMSDNVETVLMRILRGTGTYGLKGIESRDRILRPFLSLTRKDVDAYVEEHSVPYVEDETNGESCYTRNFIRNELLPLIKERFPDVERAVTRLILNCSEDERYFDTVTRDKVIVGRDRVSFRIDDLVEPAVRSRIIRRAFRSLGVYADVERRHVDIVYGLVDGHSSEHLDMPYGVKALREGAYVTLYIPRPKDMTELPIQGGELAGYRVWVERADRVVRGEGLYVDSEKVRGAVFRTRRDGDLFKRFGGGTKKLNDYLTDVKYPLSMRDRLVVLARGSEVLAIVGVEISEIAKVDDSTVDLYKILSEDIQHGKVRWQGSLR